jgi:nicotinate phosphoribosyltransferase
MLDYSPALMTDMYEYTMLDACLRDGTANRKCVFEIFTRHLPLGRHYGVAAGQGRILDALENFHLDDNDLKFLADRKVVGPETIKWLENFHFSGSIKGYREGEMFFPNSPILQVEGTFGECTLLETLLLSIPRSRRPRPAWSAPRRIARAWIWAGAVRTSGPPLPLPVLR